MGWGGRGNKNRRKWQIFKNRRKGTLVRQSHKEEVGRWIKNTATTVSEGEGPSFIERWEREGGKKMSEDEGHFGLEGKKNKTVNSEWLWLSRWSSRKARPLRTKAEGVRITLEGRIRTTMYELEKDSLGLSIRKNLLKISPGGQCDWVSQTVVSCRAEGSGWGQMNSRWGTVGGLVHGEGEELMVSKSPGAQGSFSMFFSVQFLHSNNSGVPVTKYNTKKPKRPGEKV